MLSNWLSNTRIKIFGAEILYKVITLFTGKGKRVIERRGINYEIDLAEGMELSLFLFGTFQNYITDNRFLKIERDFTILDIGANVGLMSLQLAKLVPDGKVYSFEPTFYALERLQRNLSLNPALARNIVVVNSFVSEQSSANPVIVAYSSWKVDGQHSHDDHPIHLGTPKAAEGVPSVSLDDFTERQGLKRVDFIKIDTDGHEYEVFKGARRTITQLRPQIIFEIGLYMLDEKKIDFSFFAEYFSGLSYKLLDLKTGMEVTLKNYHKYIPVKGTTDLVAMPLWHHA